MIWWCRDKHWNETHTKIWTAMHNEWALLKTELGISLAAEPTTCLVCHSEPLFRGQNPCVSRFWYLSHPLVFTGSLKEKLIWIKFSSCICRSVFSAEHFSPKRKHKSCFFIHNHSNTADYSPRRIYTGISFAGSPISFWIPCILCSEMIWGLSKQCVNQVPLGTLNVLLRALALHYISSLSLRASHPFFKYLTYCFSPVNLSKFRFHGLTPWFFHVSLSCFPQSAPPLSVPSHTSLPHGSALLSVPSQLPLTFHSESFSSAPVMTALLPGHFPTQMPAFLSESHTFSHCNVHFLGGVVLCSQLMVPPASQNPTWVQPPAPRLTNKRLGFSLLRYLPSEMSKLDVIPSIRR